MEVQTEELDLSALLHAGRVTAKRAVPPASPRPGPRPPPPPEYRMDDELIDDTSSWSESDDEEAAVVAQTAERESSSESDEGLPRTLHDPLGLQGELTTSIPYDARLDPGSVRFDAAALLSSVHYATSYDKLRQALEALRAQRSAATAQPSRGLVDSDNFQRFVATARCVETLLAPTAPRQGLPHAGPQARAAHEQLQGAAAGVLARRAELQHMVRIARFARRYHSVLALPQLVRRLAAGDDAAATVREWRRAQRVLRGMAGPVFRAVLEEVDGVARAWQATLLAQLAQPYFVGVVPTAVDDDDDDADVRGVAVTEHWAQRVEGACRALLDMGAPVDPWAHFAQAQCRAVQWNRLEALASLLPALRVAHSPLGGGTAAWTQLLGAAVDQLRTVLPPTPPVLRHAARLHAAVGRACGLTSGPAAAVAGLVRHLRRGVAQSVLEEARVRCRDPEARGQWGTVVAEAGRALRGVLDAPLVEAAQQALVECALDTLLRSAVDGGSGVQQLLEARADALALGGAGGRAAAGRAERVCGEQHARVLAVAVGRAVEALLGGSEELDAEGVAHSTQWVREEGAGSALRAVACECRLCDWVLDTLRYLVDVKTCTEDCDVDPGPLLVTCTEHVFVLLDDLVVRHREVLLANPGLASRILFDAAFLRETLRPFVSTLADGRFRQLFIALHRRTTAHIDDELAQYDTLVQCFRSN